jgi:hypothetical protein
MPFLRPFLQLTRVAALYLLLLPAGAVFGQAPAAPPAATQSVPAADTTPRQPAKRPGPPCVSAEQAAKEPNKEVCVNAHVYDLVELSDGTRFLDVCPADLADDQCRFTLISMPWDREDVGDLRRYRDQDVRVRGIVRVTRGRMGIVISHVRQFGGGPEKFRPNPKLLSGFSAQSDRMPVHDPNLRPSGHHRAFMNSEDKLPQSHKP